MGKVGVFIVLVIFFSQKLVGDIKLSGVTKVTIDGKSSTFDSLLDAKNEVIKQKAKCATLDLNFFDSYAICDSYQEPSILIGRVYDNDKVKINGNYIGSEGTKIRFTQSSLNERVYKIPKEFLKCNDHNQISLEFCSSLTSAVGPREDQFILDEYSTLSWKANVRHYVKSIFPASIALSLGLLAPLFFFLFRGEVQRKTYKSFSFFLLGGFFVSLTLSGWTLDFPFSLENHHRFNLLSIPIFLVALTEFQRAYFSSPHSVIYWINILISCVMIVVSLVVPVPVGFQIYSQYLVAIFCFNSIFLIRVSNKNDLRGLVTFIIVSTTLLLDILRFYSITNLPNLTPYGIFASVLVFGGTVASDIRSLVLSIKLNEQRAAIAQATQMIAHDVRKPFSLVEALIDVITDTDSPDEVKEILDESKSSLSKATKSVNLMINEVLTVGASANIKEELIEPSELIRDSLMTLISVNREKKIVFDFNLRHKKKLLVDRSKSKRIFQNILGNAIEQISDSARIWVHTNQKNNMMTICIGNSGSYIPSDYKDKLFDSFFTYGKEGGTGLGLSITKKLVEDHGGTIVCKSDKVKGTEFIFTLPTGSEESTNINIPSNTSAFFK